jgi:copper(I)-binding protein
MPRKIIKVKNNFLFLVISLFVILTTLEALADSQKSQLFSYQTAPAMKTGAVFGKLIPPNPQTDAVLIGANSSVSEYVEIHTMKQTPEGIWQMRKIPSLKIPNHGLEFLPSGYHLMLIDLKTPLNPGETLSLELIYQNGDKQNFSIPIIKRGDTLPHE